MHSPLVPEHTSGRSQAAPLDAAHTVVDDAQRSGQPVLTPSHTSSTSQGLFGSRGRQTVPRANGVEPGHDESLPLHVPGDEHDPAAAPPQCVPIVWKTSGGQSTLVPVHDSARSQPPATGRQTVVAPRYVAGHAALMPLHTSGASHGPFTVALHTVPTSWKESIGQIGPRPVHDSATSHAPALARHTVVGGMYESGGHCGPPAQASATSQLPIDARHNVPGAE